MGSAPGGAPPRVRVPSGDVHVLLAHASAAARRRMGRALRPAGHRLLEAGGAAQAVALCREHAPDVVVVDDELCARDRISVVDAVKADAQVFRTAVLLIVAADLGVEEVGAQLRRGVQDVLVAPVRDGELLARVQAAGRTKILQEELVEQTRRIEQHIYEDPLTRLHNRRFILSQLGALVSAARRHGRPLSVAAVDLDGFKAINDERGHAAGDQVLIAVARALRAALRAEDGVGRLGGEEFLVLLPDADPNAAEHAAERLREAVAALPPPARVTTSVGWATLADDESPDELVRRADDALYAAKAAGRNRVRGAVLGAATLPRRT
jgi:two-component system, cell cycle response regulator